ncbi:MAG TPA: hypothetical protein VF787_16275 [Thermoanaerobaculia bacterium]
MTVKDILEGIGRFREPRWLVPAVLVASAAFWWLQRLRQKSVARKTAVSEGLRSLILTAPISELADSDSSEFAAVVMDLAFADGVASVVATSLGDASLYLSNGGAIIGAGTQFAVRTAAIEFVRVAMNHRATFAPVSKFFYPEPGAMRVYLRTGDGVLVVQRSLDVLGETNDPLSPVYEAGNRLLTKLREA